MEYPSCIQEESKWLFSRLYKSGRYPSPCVMGDESIISPKKHGRSDAPVPSDLRWGCNSSLADQICNFNRRGAERFQYFTLTSFIEEFERLLFSPSSVDFDPLFHDGNENCCAVNDADTVTHQHQQITFYDSNTGRPLFVAPRGRSAKDFVTRSRNQGWLLFRNEEVVWESVRCLPDGEMVSVDGTHLGHNLPHLGHARYFTNIVSVAGHPPKCDLHRTRK